MSYCIGNKIYLSVNLGKFNFILMYSCLRISSLTDSKKISNDNIPH